jgi:zinc transport system permease protein
MFSSQFAQNALIGVMLITPLLGLLSTVVVSNKMAFFADGLGHSAFTGIAIGILLNLPHPTISLIFFSIIFALIMVYNKQKNNASMDTIIGVFSSTAIAFGLILMSTNGNLNKYSNFLVGDLIAIQKSEIIMLFFVLIATFFSFCLLFNSLTLGGLGNNWTVNKKLKSPVAEIFFTILLAIIVAISIRWVGILLINSLLVLPGATSRLVAKNSKQYVLISVVVALLAGITGLVASLFLNTSSGATIVLVLALFYFIFSPFVRK